MSFTAINLVWYVYIQAGVSKVKLGVTLNANYFFTEFNSQLSSLVITFFLLHFPKSFRRKLLTIHAEICQSRKKGPPE